MKRDLFQVMQVNMRTFADNIRKAVEIQLEYDKHFPPVDMKLRRSEAAKRGWITRKAKNAK